MAGALRSWIVQRWMRGQPDPGLPGLAHRVEHPVMLIMAPALLPHFEQTISAMITGTGMGDVMIAAPSWRSRRVAAAALVQQMQVVFLPLPLMSCFG